MNFVSQTSSEVLPLWLVQIETEFIRNTLLLHHLLQSPPPRKGDADALQDTC